MGPAISTMTRLCVLVWAQRDGEWHVVHYAISNSRS